MPDSSISLIAGRTSKRLWGFRYGDWLPLSSVDEVVKLLIVVLLESLGFGISMLSIYFFVFIPESETLILGLFLTLFYLFDLLGLSFEEFVGDSCASLPSMRASIWSSYSRSSVIDKALKSTC